MRNVTRSEILQILPAYKGKAVLIDADQEVKDIIREILTAHHKFSADYDKIVHLFDCSCELQELCESIFDFCKTNIPYRAEPDTRQTTKSPSAILAQAETTGADCKHYASFIGGILSAIERRRGKRLNWFYRFASYNMFDPTPQHVFAVLKIGASEIWIDPVLPTFNDKKFYYSKIDKKVNMSLYRVSGVNQPVNGFFGDAWTFLKKISPIGIAGRNAFLGLVALNVKGFATALQSQNQEALKKKWESLGGNWYALKETFISGAKKKRILGVEYVKGVSINGRIGLEPVTTTALLTAAAAVIAALGSFLKEVIPTAPGETADPAAPDIQQVIEQAEKEAAQEAAAKPDYTKYALIGGAALAAYFLFIKKK